MKLRLAAAEDAPMLAEVHARAFDASWTAPDIARLMEIMGGFAFLAEDDDEDGGLVGFLLARAIGGEAEVLTLAVAPWARRRGVAAALVEAAAEAAAVGGAGALFLEVATDNAAAIALYEGRGFEQAGLRRGYYRRGAGPAADALILRRTLNRPPA